ncbi:MAG: sulfite exporter TauE/SafE family protein [Candidatus Methanoperedens sp.]|nr:sulfite exporter TauE/SafE family protein [Candidatus Methanoperedens sp.]MCE8425301.1 sulfite exporter TauE/SafE family protein [Candidatus Methanoperedens sp.]MCE8427822.1 sulfite exporter TauE/SafE family protein [Candidatus Methanoperedens sp.]
MDLILLIFITFLISVLFSMLGLGGAIIYTPLFFWLGFPLLTAIPMALLLNAITTASASITYFRQRLVDTIIAFPLIFSTILGALIGSYMAPRMNSQTLVLLLSIILILAAVRLLFLSNIISPLDGRNIKVIAVISGLFIGTVSSLVGIGGGTFIVPLLMVIGLKTKNAVATSTFIVMFLSISGFLGHFGFGQQQLDLRLLFFAGMAAFAGAQVGSIFIFNRTSSRTIEKIFALILLIVALRLITG